ncbi:hypothetical protein PCANC_11734, partial [Puccinia coronata f. sp. avenae]
TVADSLPAETVADSLPAETVADSLPAETVADSLPAQTIGLSWQTVSHQSSQLADCQLGPSLLDDSLPAGNNTSCLSNWD